MSKYIIKGGKKLCGTVEISGSKNSALPVLAAALLSNGESIIRGVPDLSDIHNMLELLGCVGAKTVFENNLVKISCDMPKYDLTSYEYTSRLRASFLVLGPLLAKNGRVRLTMPGGCRIGARPIDLHLKGLSLMGANISQSHGYVEAKCKRLHGAEIYLDFPSVGATENLIMAAALADGETVIENAAVEPEISDLAMLINAMGGHVCGAGTDTVRINGVKQLCGCEHNIIPDRIEAGTFISAAVVTGGDIVIKNIIPEHMRPVTAKIRECGVVIEEGDGSLHVRVDAPVKSSDIKTLPYPGFPTDMQAQYTSMMTVAHGTSMVVETVFENRFMYVPELKRMGANVKTEGRTAVVEGQKRLTGAEVGATDLRAGAALTIAGLAASGTTQLDNVEHIDRGYENFDVKLAGLGADICKIT